MNGEPDTVEPPRRLYLWPIRVVRSRPRLFTSVACGIAVGFLLPADMRDVTRLLVAWNCALWLYFLFVAIMIALAPDDAVRQTSEKQDDGRFTILILSSLAAFAAFGGIFAQLTIVKEMHGLLRALHIGLAGLTVVSAWAFIHVMFALHYAHEYFVERVPRKNRPGKTPGGLKFPGSLEPDYLDFFYFSFVIGVACQTADVEIKAPGLRRTVMVHGVLAFFFNSAVLALSVNIAAGLV